MDKLSDVHGLSVLLCEMNLTLHLLLEEVTRGGCDCRWSCELGTGTRGPRRLPPVLGMYIMPALSIV